MKTVKLKVSNILLKYFMIYSSILNFQVLCLVNLQEENQIKYFDL